MKRVTIFSLFFLTWNEILKKKKICKYLIFLEYISHFQFYN